MSLLLGVDIGTSNLKVVAYAPQRGEIIAVARRPTRTHHPRLGWSEFLADELWAETAAAIREVVDTVGGPARIEAVSIGSMGESGVALDARGRALAPLIAWYDRRTQPQAAWWRQAIDPFALYRISGVIAEAKFSANQILWLREHQPERYAAMRHWLCVPDLVIWKLSGEQVTDYTIASRTMLFDQQRLDWSAPLLDLAGLRRGVLPTPVPSGTLVGRVRPEAAAATGLGRHTAVVSGGHDHLVGALGAGVVRPGAVLDSTGTAAVVLMLSAAFDPRRALFDAGLETYAFVQPGTFVVLGSLNLAGGAVDWLTRLLWGPGAETTALAAAAAVPPGSGGAVWLPHLLGSGTPHADERSRAAVIGLRPEHDRGHLLRAMLEGLAYRLRENLDLAVREAGLPPDSEVVTIGGATRSPFWTQLKADVCNRPFRAPRIEESVALGAALLAGAGAGVFASLEQAVASVRAGSDRFTPDPGASALYDRWYASVHQRLYATLREVHATIDTLLSS